MPEDFWVEIFQSGVHTDGRGRTRSFTDQDLDMMVSAHKATRDTIKPPIRLGDHDQLKIAGGWMSDLKRQGKSLLARFSDVPPIVREAFEKKLFRTVSIGLKFDKEIAGKRWARLVDHVAVLGGELPAVKSLTDLQAYMGEGVAAPVFIYVGNEVDEVHVYTVFKQQNSEHKEETPMSENDKPSTDAILVERIGKLEAKFTEAETKLSAACADRDEATKRAEKAEKDLQDNVAKFTEGARKGKLDELAEYCERAVKDGLMTPAKRDALLKGMDKAAVFSDEHEPMIPFSNFKAYHDHKDEKLKKGEQGQHKETGDEGDKPASVQLSELTYAYAEKHDGMAFMDAARIVRRENPELVEAHEAELAEVK